MNDKNKDDLRTTVWLVPTSQNIEWLKNEIAISKKPGHSPQKLIKDQNGRLALARI